MTDHDQDSPPARDDDAAARWARADMDEALKTNSGKIGYLTHRYQNLTRTLRYLAQRDDGWLRMVPGLDEHVVWLKWKFTRGPWEQHYVMVRVEAMRVDFGLELLVDKLHRVDVGDKKPTRDTLYGED